MINLNADIRPALRYVRLNISETQSNLNGTLNDFVSGNDTINTSMQGRFAIGFLRFRFFFMDS